MYQILYKHGNVVKSKRVIPPCFYNPANGKREDSTTLYEKCCWSVVFGSIAPTSTATAQKLGNMKFATELSFHIQLLRYIESSNEKNISH